MLIFRDGKRLYIQLHLTKGKLRIGLKLRRRAVFGKRRAAMSQLGEGARVTRWRAHRREVVMVGMDLMPTMCRVLHLS